MAKLVQRVLVLQIVPEVSEEVGHQILVQRVLVLQIVPEVAGEVGHQVLVRRALVLQIVQLGLNTSSTLPTQIRIIGLMQALNIKDDLLSRVTNHPSCISIGNK